MLVYILVVLFNVQLTSSVKVEYVDCGIDKEQEVTVGEVEIYRYPWVGVLYYIYYGDVGAETRSVTTVVLIQKEFVLAAAADIGPMPKHNFRRNTRVLLGEPWRMIGRRVRNYVLHPEYNETNTINTVALVQLKDPVRDAGIKPLCPPPRILRNPVFYVVKFQDDFTELKKEVIPVSHVPSQLCKEFYKLTNLDSKHMRPPHVACAVSLETEQPCVWQAGSALVARDVWGRWQVLGLGVRGPGCGAPARFLDMASYYPWIENSLEKFQLISITKLSKHHYVLRSSSSAQSHGACDPEERKYIIYRERIKLASQKMQFKFLTYNITIDQRIHYTCLDMRLVNASGASEISIKHICPRNSTQYYPKQCHSYQRSIFDLSLFIVFADSCLLDIRVYGTYTEWTDLPDILLWKQMEGSYYEDFTTQWLDYKGPPQLSEFGYEPIDEKMWVPKYDVWTTTTIEPSTSTTTSSTTTPTTPTTTTTTELTTSTRTYPKTKKYWRRRTTSTPSTSTSTSTVAYEDTSTNEPTTQSNEVTEVTSETTVTEPNGNK